MPRRILLQINWFSTSAIFLFISVISTSIIFYYVSLSVFFGSSVGNSATQSSAPRDNFILVINDVIHGLEDDPTQKELRVEALRAEERPPVVAQENVTTVVV
jgi:hypothetical protein